MATHAPRKLPKSRQRCQFDAAVAKLPLEIQERVLAFAHTFLLTRRQVVKEPLEFRKLSQQSVD